MVQRRTKIAACGMLSLIALAAACLIYAKGSRATPALASRSISHHPPDRGDVLSAYGKLPLVFEKNVGQAQARFDYLAHGRGYTLFLTGRGATLRLAGPSAAAGASSIQLTLSGARHDAHADGLDLRPGRDNYLIGKDASRWRRNVPLYGRVAYRRVYPGIDAVYHGNQQRLETDYVVAPGANASRIALRVAGARRLRLNPQGDLVAESGAGDLVLRRPIAYQEIAGKRRAVAANYILHAENSVALRIGSYDRRAQLIVDPVVDYSTYLGGTGGEFLSSIAVNSTGNAYITGSTSATDFPATSGAYQTTFPAGPTSYTFVTELNPSGTGLVFSTFLGGTDSGTGRGIAVDPSGNVYVTGQTSATDFPTTPNAYQPAALLGGVFFSELDPTGSQLLYSTYLAGNGGMENPVGLAIALNPNNGAYNAYILGRTSDTNFPITAANAYQTTNNTNQTDPNHGTNFLSRIDPAQNGTASLVYSTYLGGSGAEFPAAIAVDASENAYITGNTSSTDYPVVGAYQATQNNKNGDGFVSRIDTTQSGQSSLIYSTYFGGSSNGAGSTSDAGEGIAVQSNSVAVVVGVTYATAGQFPITAGALESASNAPNAIAFLARFDTTKSGASSLLYSSTWGGSTSDLALGVALDTANNIYMTGATSDVDFPVTPGAPLTAFPGQESAFLTEFSSDGASELFSTYWGGGSGAGSTGYAVATDSAALASVYFTGITGDGFPTTTGAFQTTFSGTGSVPEDGFVVKMSPGMVTPPAQVTLAPATLDFGSVNVNSASTAQTLTLTNSTATALAISGVSISGANVSEFAQTNTCGATLAPGASCTISVTFAPTASGAASATLGVFDSDPSSPQTAALSGTGGAPQPDFTIAVAPASATIGTHGTTAATVTVTSVDGFSSAVTLGCSSLPGDSTCAFSQDPVTPAANGSVTSTLTITTGVGVVGGAMPAPLSNGPNGPGGPGAPPWTWLLAAAGLAIFGRWGTNRLRGVRRAACAAALLCVAAMAGCTNTPSTPAGTFVVHVTGQSGAAKHSADFALTIR